METFDAKGSIRHESWSRADLILPTDYAHVSGNQSVDMWYPLGATPSLACGTGSTRGSANMTPFYTPFQAPNRAAVLHQIAVNVATLASGEMCMAIFEGSANSPLAGEDLDRSLYFPGQLLAVVGPTAISGAQFGPASFIFSGVVNLTLKPRGVYFACVVSSGGQPTLQQATASCIGPLYGSQGGLPALAPNTGHTFQFPATTWPTTTAQFPSGVIGATSITTQLTCFFGKFSA